MIFIFPLADFVNYLSEFLNFKETDYTLKLALFHTIFNVLGVVLMIPFISKLELFLLKIFKEIENKGIDEPKYLNEAILKFPGTLISAVLEESKYLYKNAIFEIVAHALNIHRDDIKSDINIKKIIKQSDKKIPIDIEEFYYSKVKNIYGQIINFVTRGQQELKLTKQQNKRLSELN